jgi:hypothetical protein
MPTRQPEALPTEPNEGEEVSEYTTMRDLAREVIDRATSADEALTLGRYVIECRPDLHAGLAAWLMEEELKRLVRDATLVAERAAYRTSEPLSPRSERRMQERRERVEAASRRVREAADAAIALVREQAIVEWTEELLASEFATGDGTHVTWGEASLEQHEVRAEMHRQNVVGGLEGAARHQQAIALICRSGTKNLNEATKEKAA